MEHSYIDDVTINAMKILKEKHASAVQMTSGVPIVTHIRNCRELLLECGWCDHNHWHPMVELCRLETLDEEETWQKFVGPYDDQEYAIHQRENFKLFFKRCCYLAQRDSFPSLERFYWAASGYQNETWGVLMIDALAITDELADAGRTDEALAFIRQTAPLYLSKVHLWNFEIPKEQMPSDEEKKDAWSALALSSFEEENNIYWDDLYNFDRTCTIAPKSAWLKRWHKLGGKDFWEIF